jgi:hypothetical protein
MQISPFNKSILSCSNESIHAGPQSHCKKFREEFGETMDKANQWAYNVQLQRHLAF